MRFAQRAVHLASVCLLAACLGVTVASCGGDDSTGPPSAASLDGVWSGSTSQGKTLGFTISNGVVTSLSIGFLVEGSRCTVEGSVTVSGSETIRDGRVETSITFNDPSIDISATFTSSDRAEGSVSFQSGDCGGSASATWTASKTGSVSQTANIQGTWRFSWQDMSGSVEGLTLSCDVSGADFLIAQIGTSFTGTQQGSATQTCTANGEQGEPQSVSGESIIQGAVTGSNVSFNLSSFDAVQSGTVSGSSMSGTAEWTLTAPGAPPLNMSGRFSATRMQ